MNCALQTANQIQCKHCTESSSDLSLTGRNHVRFILLSEKYFPNVLMVAETSEQAKSLKELKKACGLPAWQLWYS